MAQGSIDVGNACQVNCLKIAFNKKNIQEIRYGTPIVIFIFQLNCRFSQFFRCDSGDPAFCRALV